MVREHVAAREHLLEGQEHFLQRHLRRDAHHLAIDQLGRRHPGVALEARDAVDALGGALEALVLLQTAHELGARIGILARLGGVHARQQHARFDLGERRRHQQVFAGQLELQHLHELDVTGVLSRDLGDRDVQNVEVLPADQIEQQIERALEGLEKHLERLRRDVQVARQLGDRLDPRPPRTASRSAFVHGSRGCVRRRGRIVRHEREVGFHRISAGAQR